MNKFLIIIATLFKLGILNITYVAWYRFTLKSGIRKRWFPVKQLFVDQDLFKSVAPRTDFPEIWKEKVIKNADKIFNGQLCYYSFHWKSLGNPPNWFLNPFNNKVYPNYQKNWTELQDFNPEVGEIKNVWEASRFSWLVTLARAYAVTSNEQYLTTINLWLKDWIRKNPLNFGPNWKCGQEASIRIFNLLNTAFILKQHLNPSKPIVDFVFLSLNRIKANIRYAVAQDNNHGTSEAAALLIGGLWLTKIQKRQSKKALKFYHKGRKILENRIKKLVEADGSFSQHSTNYHRVFLDTVSFVQFWMKIFDAEPLSDKIVLKVKVAKSWLFQLTDNISGDAPNLGANDGALLLNTNSCSFRDFRPSVQIAALLFEEHAVYPYGEWDESCYWFDLNRKVDTKPHTIPAKPSKILDKAYVTLVSASISSWALLRVPRFKFRPSHNDVFHFDLWYNGKNILHDAGTFAYNPPENNLQKPLKSVTYHNTASFDDNEQMPAISRFLLGNWLKPDNVSDIHEKGNEIVWEGSYLDSKKNKHTRTIRSFGRKWILEDELSGNFQHATVRYNLKDDKYSIQENQIVLPWGSIIIENAESISINESIHAPHYFQLASCYQLQINVKKNYKLITTIALLS